MAQILELRQVFLGVLPERDLDRRLQRHIRETIDGRVASSTLMS